MSLFYDSQPLVDGLLHRVRCNEKITATLGHVSLVFIVFHFHSSKSNLSENNGDGRRSADRPAHYEERTMSTDTNMIDNNRRRRVFLSELDVTPGSTLVADK